MAGSPCLSGAGALRVPRHQISRQLHGVFEAGAINAFRLFVPTNSLVYQLAKRAYRSVKKPRLS